MPPLLPKGGFFVSTRGWRFVANSTADFGYLCGKQSVIGMDYNQLDTTQQRPPITPLAGKWGLHLGLFLSLTLVLQVYLDAIVTSLGTLFSLAEFGLAVFILYLGAKSYRETLPDAPMSYAQAFKFGALQGLFATIIVTVPFVLTLYVLRPSYPQELQQKVIELYQEMGMNEEMIEQSMKLVRLFYTKTFLLFSSISGTFLKTLIASLIASAFVQRKPR